MDPAGPAQPLLRPVTTPASSLLSLPCFLMQRILLSLPGGLNGSAAGAVCACKELHTIWRADLGRADLIAIHLRARYRGDTHAALSYVYGHEQLRSLVLTGHAEEHATALLHLAECLAPPMQPSQQLQQELWDIRGSTSMPAAQAAADVVYAAAAAGDSDVLRCVLRRRPECCSQAGLNSLLAEAAAAGRTAVVAALLDGGAEAAAATAQGWDPDAALQAGHGDVVEVLLLRGLSVTPEQLRPLFVRACQSNATGVVRILMRAAQGQGAAWLPGVAADELQAAAARGATAVLEPLLVLTVQQEFGRVRLRRALRMAVEGLHTDVAAVLLRAGADAGEALNKGITCDADVRRLQALQLAGCNVSALKYSLWEDIIQRRQRLLLRALLEVPGLARRQPRRLGSALRVAAEGLDLESATLLAQAGASAAYALASLCHDFHASHFRLLQQAGCDLAVGGGHAWAAALDGAVQRRQLALLHALLQVPRSVLQQKPYVRELALAKALDRGDGPAVDILVAAGAEVAVALQATTRRLGARRLRLLQQAGADFSQLRADGTNIIGTAAAALEAAVVGRQQRFLEALLRVPGVTRRCGSNVSSALAKAVELHDVEAARMLRVAGADPGAALRTVSADSHVQRLVVLQQAGFQMEQTRSPDWQAVLQAAIEGRQDGLLRALLNFSEPSEGLRHALPAALAVAAAVENKEAARMLLAAGAAPGLALRAVQTDADVPRLQLLQQAGWRVEQCSSGDLEAVLGAAVAGRQYALLRVLLVMPCAWTCLPPALPSSLAGAVAALDPEAALQAAGANPSPALRDIRLDSHIPRLELLYRTGARVGQYIPACVVLCLLLVGVFCSPAPLPWAVVSWGACCGIATLVRPAWVMTGIYLCAVLLALHDLRAAA